MSWQDVAAEHLSDRQLQILMLSLHGYSSREISYKLDLARTTVSDHLDAAYRNLRANGVGFGPDGRPYLVTR